MKKIFLTLSLLVVVIISSAQSIAVNYSQVKNLGMEHIEHYVLFFDENNSLYIEKEIKDSQSKEDIKDEDNEMGYTNRTRTTVIGRKDKTPQYFYNDGNAIYFLENFADNLLYVKDTSINLQWNLGKETKEIGGFFCEKATTEFRGRTYTAWFTRQIPKSFGPWKFHSTPGLILEIYDNDYKFHIYATSIIKDTSENIIQEFELSKNKYISINEYLDKKDKILDDQFAKLASKLPKGFNAPKRDKNCNDCNGEIEIFN